MQRVVLLIYHGFGHFNACFKLAKILQEKYDVVFAGYRYFEQYVTDQGFQFYSLRTVPFGLGFEAWVNETEKKKNIYWHTLKDRWAGRLYDLRRHELHQLIIDTVPHYVLIDSWQCTDFIVLYPYLKNQPIKTGFIQTMLPTQLQKNIPPVNSLVLPGNITAIRMAHHMFKWHKLKQRCWNTIRFLGQTNERIIRKQLQANHVPAVYVSTHASLLPVAFQNIDEFILTPSEFDFKTSQEVAARHYTGFLQDRLRHESPTRQYLKTEEIVIEKLK